MACRLRSDIVAVSKRQTGSRRQNNAARVVSSYLVAVYGGNSVPVIGVGLLAAVTNSTTAHVAFAVIVTVLAGTALIVGVTPHTKDN